jgi:hypothetical protein
MAKLTALGGSFNFARGVKYSLGRGTYYTLADFDRTDAILRDAARKPMAGADKARVERLALANRHARLVFQAMAAPDGEKGPCALALLGFRQANKDRLPLRWLGLFSGEAYLMHDVTGAKQAMAFRDYPLPWLLTPLVWKFKLDPGDAGVKENWQGLPFDQVAKSPDWEPMRTSNYWEDPYEWGGTAALKEKLKTYDGAAWYVTQVKVPADWKGRNVLLYFGAVDESCRVFVNGKPAGERLWQKAGDESAPFTIRIGPCLDWSRESQQLAVRVEDKAGHGGMWKRVWVLSEKADPDSPERKQ